MASLVPCVASQLSRCPVAPAWQPTDRLATTSEPNPDERLPIIECIGPRADPAAPEQARRYGIPYLPQFLRYVEMLQSGEEEPYCRRYQLETIRRGELQLPSPYTGQFARATRSSVINRKIFYQFCGSQDFYVAASRVSRGYPLAALFLPGARRLLTWEPIGNRAVAARHLQELMTLPRKSLRRYGNNPARVVVVMGNRNFAHHLWNELTALERLISKTGGDLCSEIVVSHEPLGRIDCLFPEIAHWKIHRTPDTSAQDTLYVNLASYRISEAMRMRLLRHVRRETSSETADLIRRIKEIGGPVFWLSVKTHNPTLENQREVIVAICRRLFNCNIRCSILLDGFSVPENLSTESGSEFFRSSAEASRSEIEAIVNELSGIKRRASQLVVNAGGIRLIDSIALAQLADAYFCHCGSVQHKIAWTANKPGIIHGSRKQLSKDPGGWHSERLDGAVPPLPLPIQMIKDVESGLREKNYRVNGWAVAQFVANYFSYHARH